jgi:hypothetical protein
MSLECPSDTKSTDLKHLLCRNRGEFFAGFGYALDENPACSIGGARAIWA